MKEIICDSTHIVLEDIDPEAWTDCEPSLASLAKKHGTRRELEKITEKRIIRALWDSSVLIEHLPDGTPFLMGLAKKPYPEISISHSRNTVAIAYDYEHKIGVDIEQWRPKLRTVAAKFLSKSEMEFISADTDFLKAWTAKEATFKAAGVEGLVLTDISLYPGVDTAEISSSGRQFRLKYFDYGDNLLCLAREIV